MKLNIETKNAEATLNELRNYFFNDNVEIVHVYEKTADFKISAKSQEEVVYGAESLIELSYLIPLSSIRIY